MIWEVRRQNFWGIVSLVDAFHGPKLLSQQLLPFGRSGDGLGVLTFGSSSFQFCSCLADGPRGPGGRSASTVFFARSSCSCSASLSIRFGFELWLEVVSDSTQQRADGPRVLGGQSACSPRTVRYSGSSLEVLFAFSDSPRLRSGRSAVWVRTVRGSRTDGPRGPCGQSAPPGRTVRQSLSALFFGSIPSSFFRASACASRNRS
jgi:hypothetical protein